MSAKVRMVIHIGDELLTVWVEPGQVVWDAIQETGLQAVGDCGGRGICGKCKVRIEGPLSPMTETEIEYMGEDERDQGFRLACRCRVWGDSSVYLPESIPIRNGGEWLMRDQFPRPLQSLSPLRTRLAGFDRKQPIPLLTRLKKAFPQHKIALSPENINDLAAIDRAGDLEVVGAVMDAAVIRVVPADHKLPLGLGIALDIGTTTLHCALIDLNSGRVTGTAEVENPQMVCGRDILARISYAQENPQGLVHLQRKVMQGIGDMISDLAVRFEINPDDVLEMTVVGNPVMLHLFLGLDPSGLGSSPYTGLFQDAMSIKSAFLPLPLNPSGRIYLLPQVAGFLGADIVACLLAMNISDKERVLLIDVGTNGEMFLKYEGRMWACSVAAGCAFEGGGILSGTRAASGAIDRFWAEEGRLRYNVLGGQTPRGICGSGLVDLLAVLLDLGVIDETGLIHPDQYQGVTLATERGTRLVLAGEVSLDQQDIRELQMAKGAFRAGIELLTREAGISAHELDHIYLAGSFGNHLDVGSLIRIGLLPPVEEDKVKNIGNAALRGAMAALISVHERDKAVQLAAQIGTIDLASHPEFPRVYMESIALK